MNSGTCAQLLSDPAFGGNGMFYRTWARDLARHIRDLRAEARSASHEGLLKELTRCMVRANHDLILAFKNREKQEKLDRAAAKFAPISR